MKMPDRFDNDRHFACRRDIESKLNLLRSLSVDIDALTGQGDAASLKKCIDCRRTIAMLFVELQTLCLSYIREYPNAMTGTGANDLHAGFGSFRHSLAMMQSKWPVVAIARDISGYNSARTAFREEEQKLDQWIRTLIA